MRRVSVVGGRPSEGELLALPSELRMPPRGLAPRPQTYAEPITNSAVTSSAGLLALLAPDIMDGGSLQLFAVFFIELRAETPSLIQHLLSDIIVAMCQAHREPLSILKSGLPARPTPQSTPPRTKSPLRVLRPTSAVPNVPLRRAACKCIPFLHYS